MANTFTIIGEVKIPMNGNLYEEKNAGNGKIKTCKMQVVANGNTLYPEITSYQGDKIYTILEENGERKFKEISYADRDKYIDKIANFKKYVLKTKEFEVEYATQGELAERFAKLLKEKTSGKFKLVGEVEYNEYNGKVYSRYNVTRIYEVDTDEEEIAESRMEVYITGHINSEHSITLKGLSAQYDSKKKADKGYPVEIIIPTIDKTDKWIDKLEELITPKSEDTLSKIGLKVNVVAKKADVEFDESMLSEEDKEMLEYGFMSLDELKAQYGVGKGSFEKKLEFVGFTRGYNQGCVATEITLESLTSDGAMVLPEIEDFDIEDMFAD